MATVSAPKLRFLIGDVLPPDGFAHHRPQTPLDASPFDRLLNQGKVSRLPGTVLEEAILDCFGLSADSPVAPLTWMADYPAPPQSAVVRADPVHLAVSRDNVQLLDPDIVNPTKDEMQAITESLNAHYASQGLTFAFPNPKRGYVALREHDLPAGTPIWRMPGANVFDHLVLGKTLTNWRAVLNEIQMLLHAHPVNEARQTRGEVAINGLWFWGAGSLPNHASACPDLVVSDDPIALGATKWLGGEAASTDTTLAALLSQREADEILIVLDRATHAVRAVAPEAWQAARNEIGQRWLNAAMDAQEAGHIGDIDVTLANESMTIHVAYPSANGLAQRLLRGVNKIARRRLRLADFE
jgi:hypothetical protein